MAFITDKGAVAATTLFCGAVVTLGHGLLWIGYSTGLNDPNDPPPPIAWQPVVGITMSLVAIAAFGGFFRATEKIRVAIASAVLLSFIVLVSFVLGIGALAENAANEAKPFVDAFVDVVQVVAGFYFGSEAVVTGAKVYASAQTNGTAEQAQAADSDLPKP